MFSLSELNEACSCFSSYYRTGVPTVEAVSDMVQIQSAHAEFWTACKRGVENGHPLSDGLKDEWPDAIVAAVVAGEDAGQHERVFAHLEEVTTLQLAFREQAQKLLYPVAMCVMAFFATFLTMIFVAAPTAVKLKTVHKSGLAEFAVSLRELTFQYWVPVVLVLVVAIVLVARWAISQKGQDQALGFALKVPFVAPGIIHLQFGIWAKYMQLMLEAGITADEAVRLTIPTMPTHLQAGLRAFRAGILDKQQSVAYAAGPDADVADDPRRIWPGFIVRAFRVGDRTGELSTQFEVVSPTMIKVGTRRMAAAVKTLVGAAIVVAALLMLPSFAGIYVPIFTALDRR